MKTVLFISGIDTDVGKTVATGLYARELAAAGHRVITQKLVQTGCSGIAGDILSHRRLQGIGPTAFDNDGTTAPYVFPYPCSPHLAAAQQGTAIEPAIIRRATETLLQHYDTVLLEGAGGLMVPLAEDYTLLDYVAGQDYPVVLVTGGKLGSINHTLLSLDALTARKLRLHRVVYNRFPLYDPLINAESERYLRRHIQQHFPQAEWRVLDPLPEGTLP
ncbi:dethiobiotin synthase [Neisseria sp.]|uniref:dethiobiotin synthase n=1 Tax=Neisseria sp. TaxID=192066 RepID=UPI00289E8263|nr:dethiobiotin synthase [Neisseria sp.]